MLIYSIFVLLPSSHSCTDGIDKVDYLQITKTGLSLANKQNSILRGYEILTIHTSMIILCTLLWLVTFTPGIITYGIYVAHACIVGNLYLHFHRYSYNYKI